MLSDADVTYIRDSFVPLDELCARRGIEVEDVRGLVQQRCLPRASYILDDGTEMAPPDYFALYDAARDEPVEALFRRRLAARAQELGVSCGETELAEEWEGYLSGDFGVCLREVTPENICAKGMHMTIIEQLLAAPRPRDQAWLDELAQHVNALDRLERPFAQFDRARWGAVSRDRLIIAVRERYPQAFAEDRPRDA